MRSIVPHHVSRVFVQTNIIPTVALNNDESLILALRAARAAQWFDEELVAMMDQAEDLVWTYTATGMKKQLEVRCLGTLNPAVACARDAIESQGAKR
jgi:hypothetical protein